MNYLIAGDCGIYFDVKSDARGGILVYCVDLRGGGAKLIGRSAELGLNSCLLLIKDYREAEARPSGARVSEWGLLAQHIARYRDNVYGLFCDERETGKEWVGFFREAYIFYFALELSNVFFSLRDSEQASFESFLDADNSGLDEEVSELRGYYNQWKAVSMPDREAGRFA